MVPVFALATHASCESPRDTPSERVIAGIILAAGPVRVSASRSLPSLSDVGTSGTERSTCAPFCGDIVVVLPAGDRWEGDLSAKSPRGYRENRWSQHLVDQRDLRMVEKSSERRAMRRPA